VSDSLEGWNRRRLAGQAVPMRLSLKTAPLREHDQESWVLFVDLVKAYDTVNREMLWKILTTGVPESNRNAQNLYTDVTINFRVGEKLEQFLSTSRVKATI
jgi:hypothetical protein